MSLETVNLGRHGLKVSRLCLGTMVFGSQCDETASVAVLDEAEVLGFKARAHIGQLRSGSMAASPSRAALSAQLDGLSAAELQSLLQRARDDKHST